MRPRSTTTRSSTTRSTTVTRTTVLTTVATVLLLAPGIALAAGDGPGPVAPAPAGWVRPVPGAVVQPFDPPASGWSAGHRGVDLAAPAGDVVRTPAHGAVTFAGTVAGKPVVVVAHDGGLRSTFEPAVATVPRGSAVSAGDAVARVAPPSDPASTAGHCGPAGCLHWGVLRGATYLDPLLLLGEDVPIVLLPTGG